MKRSYIIILFSAMFLFLSATCADAALTGKVQDVLSEMLLSFLRPFIDDTLKGLINQVVDSIVKSEDYLIVNNPIIENWYPIYVTVISAIGAIVLVINASLITWEGTYNPQAALVRIKELLPRFIIGVLLSIFSIWICQLILTLDHIAVEAILTMRDASDWVAKLNYEVSNFSVVSFEVISLLVLGVAAMVLGIIDGGREIMLELLALLGPIAGLMWVFNETKGYFFAWLKEYILWAFTHLAQVTCLIIGFSTIFVNYESKTGFIIWVLKAIALITMTSSVPMVLRVMVNHMFVRPTR